MSLGAPEGAPGARLAASEPTLPSIVRNVPVIRGAAMALVILNHSVLYSLGVVGVLDSRPPDWPGWRWAIELVVFSLTEQSIPAFFFASGFFMYRFTRSWPAAKASAKAIARSYLLWAVPGYVLLAVLHRHVDLRATVLSFLTQGPYFGTYWFLLCLFQMSLLAPLLVRWVGRSPGTVLAATVGLQLAASAILYVGTLRGTYDVAQVRIVVFRMPFVLLGMLVSAHSDQVVRFLVARRRQVAFLAAAAQLLPVLEGVAWGHVRGDGSPTLWLYGVDKISLVLAAAAALAWSLTLRSDPTPVRGRLTSVGMHSMAILLASDLCFMATARVIWHAGAWLGMPAPAPGVAPTYMRAVWMCLPLYAAGMLGPLVIADAVERALGKQSRKLLFG